jgi:2-keto-4-pentenoate hydratase/2-oxohepta-3-ene-1,7-dioic acid hydratase in catechol pathway
MRILRLGPVGAERPAVIDAEGTTRDISSLTADIDGAFLSSGGLDAVRSALESGSLPAMETDGVRVGAPIAKPEKIVCIGLNYRGHAAETGQDVPAEPMVFLKAPNAMCGPYDAIHVPRGGDQVDWEVELGVVIGRRCRYLADEAEALSSVAGYTISHDVSERGFQLKRGGQFTKGKSCETFNPLGPWLVTPDEVGDTGRLGLRTWVNGSIKQDGSTDDFVFGVAQVVHYLSQFMVLEPGDLITTGTPAGVGHGRKPREYLGAGDTVELEIDQLGRQRSVVVTAP